MTSEVHTEASGAGRSVAQVEVGPGPTPTFDAPLVCAHLPPPSVLSRPVLLVIATLLLAGAQVLFVWGFAHAGLEEVSPRRTCRDLEDAALAASMSPDERVWLELRCLPSVTVHAMPAPESAPQGTFLTLEQPPAENPKPLETKYLAARPTRTERETQVAVPPKPIETAVPPSKARPRTPQKPPSRPVDSASEPRSKPPADTAEGAESASAEDPGGGTSIMVAGAGTRGTGRPRTGPPEDSHGLLSPIGSSGAALKNFLALEGDGGEGGGALEGVEPGKETVLNANTYRYADYFGLIKESVERHWDPNAIYLKEDPDGRRFGVKDRYTILRVVLDARGEVKSVTVIRASGLAFMDAEARRAMLAAAPFPNPPMGLRGSDGLVQFDFGFFFEVVAGQYRFSSKRL